MLDTSDMSATEEQNQRHECNRSATPTTRGDTSYTSENTFSHSCTSYMANGRLQGEKKFNSKNYIFENASFPCQNALEKCTTKTELSNDKNYIKKLYTRL